MCAINYTLSGGGGGGGSDDPCPYAGVWEGRYDGDNTEGNVYITIKEDGDMKCKTVADNSGYWTESSGRMKNNGQFTLEGKDEDGIKGKITGQVEFDNPEKTVMVGVYKLYVGSSLYESGGWALQKK